MPDFLSNAKMNQVSPAGSIAPMTFICPDGVQGAFMCRTATANTAGGPWDLPLGVSQVGFNLTPNLISALTDGAASDPNVAGAPGSQIQIFTSGDVCPIRLGAAPGTVVPGAFITNDSTGLGKVIAALTANSYMGGVALQAGLAGEIIEIYVLPGRV